MSKLFIACILFVVVLSVCGHDADDEPSVLLDEIETNKRSDQVSKRQIQADEPKKKRDHDQSVTLETIQIKEIQSLISHLQTQAELNNEASKDIASVSHQNDFFYWRFRSLFAFHNPSPPLLAIISIEHRSDG